MGRSLNVGLIDAELSYAKKHRFPNLVCMKLSRYHKANGDRVTLIENPIPSELQSFDKIYLSKVFTATEVPNEIQNAKNVLKGGTGFFFEKAAPLPEEVEHSFPDYHLYDNWLGRQKNAAWKHKYTDFSIGYTTRGCFRKCDFCVNKLYDKVVRWSRLSEFLDRSRPYIGLCDDNMLGCPEWREILEELQGSGKPFCYNQGLDVRLLTKEKADVLHRSRYKGSITFAFDDIDEAPIITARMGILDNYEFGNPPRFFVLTGYDKHNKYDERFWLDDIHGTLERIKILFQHRFMPYITRFERQWESPYIGVYGAIANWIDRPLNFTSMTLRELATDCTDKIGTRMKASLEAFEKQNPWVTPYLDMRWRGRKDLDNGDID